jgi:hypothetical protein
MRMMGWWGRYGMYVCMYVYIYVYLYMHRSSANAD